MWLSHFRSWELVVPRYLNDSTAVTELFMMVSGERAGWGLLLKSTIISMLLSVLRSRLFRLRQTAISLTSCLSVSRLVTVLNEADQCGDVCKLQELDGGVFKCTVIRVHGEEQWGENTALRSSSADRCGCWMCIFPASLAAACLSGFWWSTDRRRWGQRELYQFILKGVWRDDGVKSGAVVYKEDPHISPWSVQMLQDEVQSHVDCIIHRPVCSVVKLQGVQ